MTATAPIWAADAPWNPVVGPGVRSIGPPRLTAGLDRFPRLDWAQHLGVHGCLPEVTRHQLERLTETVRLLGRGGAGFPVATKVKALPLRGVGAVVVNGSESEPGSWKDRVLMRRAPHLVIDGAVGVARAVGAAEVVIVVHDGEAARSLQWAVLERADGHLVRIATSPGRFVSGEARAVILAAENRPALPPGRRVLPTHRGYAGAPTFISNAETFAQVAVLIRLGGAYADTGIAMEPGTTLLTVGGAVRSPGVVEIPLGMPLPALLASVGAPTEATVLLGGYHGMFVADIAQTVLSRPSVAQQGASLGAGVVLVLGDDTCPLAEVEAVVHWLASQSAGQCGPCVFGLPSLAQDLTRVRSGDPDALVDLRRHLGVVVGRGACAHPDGVTRFVASAVATFGDHIEAHRQPGGCGREWRGQLPLPPLDGQP